MIIPVDGLRKSLLLPLQMTERNKGRCMNLSVENKNIFRKRNQRNNLIWTEMPVLKNCDCGNV